MVSNIFFEFFTPTAYLVQESILTSFFFSPNGLQPPASHHLTSWSVLSFAQVLVSSPPDFPDFFELCLKPRSTNVNSGVVFVLIARQRTSVLCWLFFFQAKSEHLPFFHKRYPLRWQVFGDIFGFDIAIHSPLDPHFLVTQILGSNDKKGSYGSVRRLWICS